MLLISSKHWCMCIYVTMFCHVCVCVCSGGRAALPRAGWLGLAAAQEKESCKFLISPLLPVWCHLTHKLLSHLGVSHELLPAGCFCFALADASQRIWGDKIFGNHDCQWPQPGMYRLCSISSRGNKTLLHVTGCHSLLLTVFQPYTFLFLTRSPAVQTPQDEAAHKELRQVSGEFCWRCE